MSPWRPAALLNLIPSSTADKCTAFVKALIRIPTLLYDFFVWMISAEGNVTREFQNWLGIAVPGDIKATFDTEDQTGWLECNGAVVSRTTYADLFTTIGTTYGAGDGSTTFQLPDLRGRVIGASGAGSGLTSRSLGEEVGAESHTLTISEMPAHSHTITDPKCATYLEGGEQAQAGTGAANKQPNSFDPSTDSTGGGGSHNNMQPTIFARWLIKY